ncbi:MAG: PQQ-dependent sugar dehydrogenase [Acidobacteria bacterium]|nr:PQQ-dependent sugar dehydrogenase [Acidobacteriota bacterium]
MRMARVMALVLVAGVAVLAQSPTDPFPAPIPVNEGVIRVRFVEFASIPDVGGEPARMMLLVDEPGTRRLFVNDMRGPLYAVSYDGRTVAPYLDINAPQWGVAVQAAGRERGFQSFALHPQFGRPGTPGFGKLYTWTDTSNMTPPPDFRPGGGNRTHATVLLEWTARTPTSATYDGGPPRELLRLEQPFANHNGGHMSFNPLVAPGSADFGLLYVGVADGGSGGDPLNLAQNLGSPFGKVLRIDPLGGPHVVRTAASQHWPVGSQSDPTLNSTNRKYGIPASNPFAGKPGVLGEIYAYGVRNPQRFGWDQRNGNLFLADIGQNIVEELSLVSRGANLGWNKWEGSFGYISREAVDLTRRRADPTATYPVVEYGQLDPLLQGNSAITGVHVYRSGAIPQLMNLVLFGDFPSGEIFYVHADRLPNGGQDAIRRVLLNDGGESKTLLQVIREKNVKRGRPPASRADLRFGAGPDGRVFLLNKHDGTIRLLVPDGQATR